MPNVIRRFVSADRLSFWSHALCLILKFELELRVDEGEAHAVVFGRTELLDGLSMCLGGISLVLGPLVGRVVRRDFVHVVVTVGLG